MRYLSGITTRSRPKLILVPLKHIPFDLSNVIINSGVGKHITDKIECPVDGVYFLSVSVMNNGKTLVWLSLFVWKNSKDMIWLGMGSKTKDYAADENAFIHCKKGDNISLRYYYVGFPGIHWTSFASITLILMAPSGNYLQFSSQ